MPPNIEYPKPFPKQTNESHTLETGFTSTEIVALQNGWRLTKRGLNSHSMKIFTEVFSEYYFLLERFRVADTQKFNLTGLHQHNHQIMDFYGCLIESGFTDVRFINMMLSGLANRHKSHGVTYDEIKIITTYIKHYFIDLLDKYKSATFISGLSKLTELISEHHRE